MPSSRASDPDPYVPHHGSRDFVVDHYDLDLRYRVGPNRLEGRARLDVRAVDTLDELRLDLVGLRVARVEVDGARVRHAHRKGSVRLRLADALQPGGTAAVTIAYAGNPAPATGAWGDVGWEELTDGALVAGQPTGAPTWFPCNDHPGYKATYDLSFTTDAPYTVVANAPLRTVTRRAGTRTWTFERTEPMCTYLATVQVGPYDVVASGEHARVARPAGRAADVRHDLDRHDELFSLFEGLFGPYPFAGYTVVVTSDPLEIPLEAHGLSVFGANHLDGSKGSDRLVAHELAHQWFGNSVSVRQWRDIWLNEGFACYAEWLWSEASGGPAADQLAREHHGRLAVLDQDLVIADPGPRLMFDDRLYKRGALTLHALRLALGDDTFFALLHTWTDRYRHGHATTADLRALVRELAASTDGLEELLDRWLDARGLPDLPPGGDPSSRGAGLRERAARPR
ncbi:M1 family metallopeptidase [Isoptericola halotolerans]|uniref:M1 family metallopeptidase n=1 Tax=Isoptericola halotolerans TaxID=300560 RepID=UPI003890F0A0